LAGRPNVPLTVRSADMRIQSPRTGSRAPSDPANTVEVMRSPSMPVDTTTAVLGVLTLLAFATAGAMRLLVDLTLSGTGPQQYTSAMPAVPFDRIDALSDVGACAIGAGILLFAATLVAAVARHRGARLPMTLATLTAAVAIAATVFGIGASQAGNGDAAFDLDTMRTALAAIAGACLPAVVVSAVRARRRA
jgi:hypothetical protein